MALLGIMMVGELSSSCGRIFGVDGFAGGRRSGSAMTSKVIVGELSSTKGCSSIVCDVAGGVWKGCCVRNHCSASGSSIGSLK